MFLTALEALVACAVFAVGIALLVLIAKQKREIETKDRVMEKQKREMEKQNLQRMREEFVFMIDTDELKTLSELINYIERAAFDSIGVEHFSSVHNTEEYASSTLSNPCDVNVIQLSKFRRSNLEHTVSKLFVKQIDLNEEYLYNFIVQSFFNENKVRLRLRYFI
jgi:hypothetical protein